MEKGGGGDGEVFCFFLRVNVTTNTLNKVRETISIDSNLCVLFKNLGSYYLLNKFCRRNSFL